MPRRRPVLLLLAMVVAIAVVVAGLGWDADREADAALADLAAEQAQLAKSVGHDLGPRLASAPLASVLGDFVPVERPGDLIVLVLAPGATTFAATDGRAVDDAALREAALGGRPSLRLGRPEAARLGLPERAAFAGFAAVETPTGRYVVAVVASAWRERDREIRAHWRLALGTIGAAGLVLAFGGLALREIAREQRLATELRAASVAKIADERLARATKAAMLGTLASGIAHEVGTPLGIIQGRAEQLRDRVATEPRSARAVDVILEQVTRIHETVRGFLGLARGATPALVATDPTTLVRAAVDLVAHRFERAAVTVATDVPADAPRVTVNARLFEHALTNLLLNACDACAAGGRVTVTVRADEGVAFVVDDDGGGIAPADAARATEPFFTTKAEGQGTGLGLAIATEIAHIHRGALRIGPRDGGGTRVVIEIPKAPEAA